MGHAVRKGDFREAVAMRKGRFADFGHARGKRNAREAFTLLERPLPYARYALGEFDLPHIDTLIKRAPADFGDALGERNAFKGVAHGKSVAADEKGRCAHGFRYS